MATRTGSIVLYTHSESCAHTLTESRLPTGKDDVHDTKEVPDLVDNLQALNLADPEEASQRLEPLLL